MSHPPSPLHDPARLAALKKLGLMDSGSEAAFDRFTRLACSFLGVPTSTVTLVDDARQYFKAQTGLSGWPAEKRETPLSHSYCKHVVNTGVPFIVNDAPHHPDVCDNGATTELGIKAYLGLPIRSPDGHVLGSFCAIDTNVRAWTQREIDLMTELAELVMNEIALRHENQERLRAETELQKLNQLQQAVLDGTTFGIVSTTPEGVITTFSRGAEVMFGYARDEVVGIATPERFHVKSEVVARATELSAKLGRRIAPGFETFVHRVREGQIDVQEWTFVRKDGSRFPARLTLNAMRNAAGEITGILGVTEDLTVQRKAVQELQRVENRLHHVLGQADCLVWEAELTHQQGNWDWRFTVHPSGLFHRLLGQKLTDPSRLWHQFEMPDKEETNRRCHEACLGGAPGYNQEFRLVKGRRTTWVRESVSIVQSGPSKFWLVGVVTDITRMKEISGQLEQSEARFRDAFDHAGIGMALIGLDGGWRRVNRAICEIVGYSELELMKKTFQDLTHPDDLDQDQQYVQDLIGGKARVYQIEKRCFHRSGDVVWIRLTSSLVHDAAGAPLHFVAQIEDITVRKRLVLALRESEERLSNVFRSMVEGLVLQRADGSIVECNEAALRILGLERHELKNRTSLDPRWEIFRADGTQVPGEEHPAMVTLRTGKPCRAVELGVRRVDGDVTWLSVNTEPFADAGGAKMVVVSFADITERRRAESAMRESEQRMRLFAEHAPAAVAMFDREMRYLVHSAKWVRDYHLEGQTILGRSHYDVFPEIGDDWKEIHRRCLDGAVEVNEADPFTRADGSRQWLSWRVQPWHNEAGEIGGIVMFTEDITQRKILEENLAKARDEALAASKLKSEFLANMSHEIRTPMNGVIGMADLLMGTSLTAEQKQMGGVIRSSADSLLTIINDILDFSKIEAGKMTMEAIDFELAELVHQTVAMLLPRAQTRNLTLQADLSAGLPIGLSGDVGRIRQILVNLVSNAVKFTEKGGVTVAVRPGLLPSASGRFVIRFEVRDTGIGISAEQKQKLFQPFTQADGSTTRKYGGTGLGLAISRQLVDLMSGTIGLESEPGRGSIFWFELELPVVTISRVTRPPMSPVLSRASFPVGTAPRILVAEDNAANQLVIRLLLEKMGYVHDIVGDGIAALERLAVGEYAAVLMDCQMPRLDGYEASQRVRAGAAGPHQVGVPIIALTAHAMASDREKCLAAGMDEYLSKPVRIDELRAAFRRLSVGVAPGLTRAPMSMTRPPMMMVEQAASPLDADQLAQLRGLPGREGGTLLDDLVEMVLNDLPRDFVQLKEFSDRQASADVKQLAHRLAGSAANFGAMRLRELLQELERTGQKGEWTEVANVWRKLDQEWVVVRDALHKLQGVSHS